MKKENVNKNNNVLLKLVNVVIITTLIALTLGIVDWVLDILHTKGDMIGTWFLIIGIVMSIPGLTWLIVGIILLVKDKSKQLINDKDRKFWIIVMAISFAAFIPLWIEGFIEGNGMPMFQRAIYRQAVWMIVWIIYLITCLSANLLAWKSRCSYLYKK